MQIPETSPFDGVLKTPEAFDPLIRFLYAPSYFLADKFDRPMDQSTYMLASIAALICSLTLKNMNGTPFQR